MAILLGLDYGTARIGCALSDDDETVAVAAGVLPGGNFQEALHLIQTMVHEKNVRCVVVGLPLAMSGKETQQTAATRSFVQALHKAVSIPVETYDERLTSSQANHAQGVDTVDERAAVILLQAYLDRERWEREQKNP